MKGKTLRYIATMLIGVGFILMAVENQLNSELASALQAALGAVFVVVSLKRLIAERR